MKSLRTYVADLIRQNPPNPFLPVQSCSIFTSVSVAKVRTVDLYDDTKSLCNTTPSFPSSVLLVRVHKDRVRVTNKDSLPSRDVTDRRVLVRVL